MRSLLLCLVVGLSQVAVQAADDMHFVDLSSHFNQKLTDNLGRGFEGNHLKELPTGEQTFESIKFRVGDGIVQLGSSVLTKMPEKITGISIGRKLSKLHFLHATMYGGGPNNSDSPFFVKDGTLIGEYLINYEDKSSEGVSVVYGKTVRDWFFRDDEEGVTQGKIAWKGDNPFAMQQNCRIRLYTMTWENPKPTRKVVSIDYIGRKNDTVAAPFVVAITLSEQSP